MIPQISQAIFYQIFPPGQRGMALAFALMGWSIGPAFGPFMGGNLLEFASWRVVYGITLTLSGVGFSWPGGGCRTYGVQSDGASITMVR